MNYAEIVDAAINRNPLFDTLPWWTAFKNGHSTYEQIIDLLANTDFALFLTTPDDKTESRSEIHPVSRANVLLEYGIFSGHLGPENALRLHIGKTADPSDLYGVVNAFAKIDYRPGAVVDDDERAKLEAVVADALADLLKPADGGARLDIEFMRARNYYAIDGGRESIISLLETQQLAKLRDTQEALRDYDFLERIIKRYTVPEEHEVGLDGHKTVTKSFIDFEKIGNNAGDEQLLSHAFSHFVARTIIDEFGEKPPSRFSIPDAEDQLPFLAATLEHLRAKPAIVRPKSRCVTGSVKGRFFGTERSVLLQGITSTGNTPSCCCVELFKYKIRTVALISFIAKAEHVDDIQKFCSSRNMAFYPMLLQHEDGSITVARDI